MPEPDRSRAAPPAPPPEPPPPPQPRLGVDAPDKPSENWIASDQPGEHAGKLSQVEQPQLRPTPPSPAQS
ncbi:MAG: hypothetical protein JNK35_04915, partial [Phycisphaerae bacterium]|nr:hypothetical protein [Phycisphaerae bacterium]